MSSIPSATELLPDRRLRILVVFCGALLQLGGIVLLVALPLPILTRLLMLAAWLGLAWRDWCGRWRAYRQITAIRPDQDGGISGIGPDGECQPLQLLGGSLVLRRVAWLHLELADRTRYAELLTGNSRHCARWHWLQLCWHQRRSRFGRPDRS